MSRPRQRMSRAFRPAGEALDGRLLLSADVIPTGRDALSQFLFQKGYTPAIRPNTPVVPLGQATAAATFIDPSVRILNGFHVVLASNTYVAPYAVLDATRGFIRIGSGSTISNNVQFVANPGQVGSGQGIQVGNKTVVDDNAIVRGPSIIGGFEDTSAATYVGPGALVDGAKIEPGAIVSALARVGPGVTLPTGFRVLPGKNVTTNAQASNPALGKVVAVTAADRAELDQIQALSAQLASGYTNLYQGNSATGTSPYKGPGNTTFFNGNLAAVSGASFDPGTTYVPASGASKAPFFLNQHSGKPIQFPISTFRARAVGDVQFTQAPAAVASALGFHNVFRGDQGGTILVDAIAGTGNNVSIDAILGGTVTLGRGLRTGDNVVIRGGTTAPMTTGENVTIGAGAVVSQSRIGAGASIGARSYVLESTVAPGAKIAPGTILIRDKVVGKVEW